MTMRAYFQRNSASANAYGHKSPQSWGTLSITPCYAWIVTGDTRHGEVVSADATRYRAIIPSGTAVTSDDRVQKIDDRAGGNLFGVLYIDAVLRRHDHLELRMRDHE